MFLESLSLETLQNFAQHYGYLMILFGIMLESLGIPLPGESVVLMGGFLAGEGELRYSWVLASAVTGAITGNTFGYWVGVYGGWPLISGVGKLFQLSEDRLLEIKQRFSHNAGRAVLLGRFVALLRIFAGPLAGIAGMPFGQFMIYNCFGAILWAAVMVTLAFGAGQVVPLGQLMLWVGQFGVLLLGGIAAWFTMPWLVRLTRRQVLKQASESESS